MKDYLICDTINNIKQKNQKGAFYMQAVAKCELDEIQKARKELFRELDKGIRDMERGDVIPCDEAIRQIREKYGLINV